MSHQLHLAIASWAFGCVLLLGAIRSETVRSRALGAFVKLCVGVSELDGDVSDLLLVMLDCVDSGDSPHKSGLSVRNMANSSNINGRLP